jgi:hypothetical protein
MKMKSLILLVFSLILASCYHAENKVVEVEFNVNKALLADSSFLSSTGFSIYPPKNWQRTASYNTELQDKILNRIENKLLAIYKCDSTNCALVISELPEMNYKIIRQQLERQNPGSGGDSQWTKVETSFFKYKSYEVIQIVSQNSELVVFKLYTHRLSDLYELDFMIPRSEINSNMQTVESSIGSIN